MMVGINDADFKKQENSAMLNVRKDKVFEDPTFTSGSSRPGSGTARKSKGVEDVRSDLRRQKTLAN